MDLGHFARSPRLLWSWILLPILMIVLIIGSSNLYCLALGQTRAGVQSHYAVIPDMHRSLNRAGATLDRFSEHALEESATLDKLSVLFYEAGLETGFDVISIQIDKADPSPREGLGAHRITVIGEGAMAGAMRYLDALHAPRRLIEVEATNLNVKDKSAVAVYNGRFVFLYYSLNTAG